MKVEKKIQMEQILKNEARQRLKDRINEKIEIQIQHFKNKNKTRNDKTINTYHTFNQPKYNNPEHYIFHHNHTNTYTKYLNNTKIEELNNNKNYSDYEAMWEIAINKWTRKGNFYRERLTDSILNKFDMNNKRQKNTSRLCRINRTKY